MAKKSTTPSPALQAFRATVIDLVSDSGVPDLSARQTGVLLTALLEQGPLSVAEISAALKIDKPCVTRALDRLQEYEFVTRSTDENDRRKIIVSVTAKGSAYVKRISAKLESSLKAAA